MRGVPFVIDGETHYFRGTISVISADNPASAALGGFKQSASAFRFCLHCLGNEADIQSKVQLHVHVFVCMCWCGGDVYVCSLITRLSSMCIRCLLKSRGRAVILFNIYGMEESLVTRYV